MWFIEHVSKCLRPDFRLNSFLGLGNRTNGRCVRNGFRTALVKGKISWFLGKDRRHFLAGPPSIATGRSLSSLVARYQNGQSTWHETQRMSLSYAIIAIGLIVPSRIFPSLHAPLKTFFPLRRWTCPGKTVLQLRYKICPFVNDRVDPSPRTNRKLAIRCENQSQVTDND